MARKFKCRNGTILEECKKGEHLLEYFTNKGYSSNYNVIYDPSCKYKKGKFMGLRAKGQVYFPVGGVYGSDYDIVEELKPKKQKKEAALAKAKWFEYAGDKRIELLLNVIESLHLPYEIKASAQFGVITEKTITIRV